MRVSVVVPAYNGADVLRETVPALLALDGVDEWVWVDDGSVDGTAGVVQAETAGELRARVVRQGRNTGRGAARNRGVAETTGDVVVFFDADVRPPPDASERLVGALGSGVASVARVRPVLTDAGDPYQVYLARGRRGPPDVAAGSEVSWRYFLSGVCAVRRPALDAAGGFDPSVPYGEDFALACALAVRHPRGLRLAGLAVDLLGVGTLPDAIGNAGAFGAALPALASRYPGALALAGVGGAVRSRALRTAALGLGPALGSPALTLALRALPRPAQAKAVRYLLGHALLVGFHGARDPSP